jgi:hypothetical protein
MEVVSTVEASMAEALTAEASKSWISLPSPAFVRLRFFYANGRFVSCYELCSVGTHCIRYVFIPKSQSHALVCSDFLLRVDLRLDRLVSSSADPEMPPSLPVSLSPHICIVSSPDVEVALRSAALPTLPQILQSFSPLSSGKATYQDIEFTNR